MPSASAVATLLPPSPPAGANGHPLSPPPPMAALTPHRCEGKDAAFDSNRDHHTPYVASSTNGSAHSSQGKKRKQCSEEGLSPY
eukprot:1158865-Pelagomonas_calceolata.AAC.2